MSEERATNQKVGSTLKRKLLEKYNHRCVICGVGDDTAPLNLVHLVPLSRGGESSEDNLTILCENCHRSVDRQPREIEFASFVTELLARHSDYSNVQREVVLGRETRYRADILASRRENGKSEVLLIECKTYPALTAAIIHRVVEQLDKYKAISPDCRMVLAIPATLREEELSVLSAANIETWDLRYMVSRFSKQIRESEPSYYKALLLSQIRRPNKLTREQELIKSLESCMPGRADCYVYQTLVGEILECLFTPPLGKPISELSDKSESNRRDFIMPNYTEIGFWSFLRQRYGADYIVIDAKNYTEEVGKGEVLQIANYLKSHGAGLFGLIISRKGGDTFGCDHTLREQWTMYQKLILVLNDEDIKSMLMAKADGRLAEDVLGQKIEQFRLSM